MQRTIVYSLLLIAFLVVPPAQAEGVRFLNVDAFTLASHETLLHELWLVAGPVDAAGTAEENLFILGGETRLGGVFHKDVWALSHDVVFTGHVHQSARLMGRGPVTVDGAIDSSLMAASGRNVQLGPDARVGRDVILMGRHVIVRGVIGRNVRVMAREATLGGDIGGTVRLQADDIVVLPGTRIGGDFIYTAPKELVLDRHVRVEGSVIHQEPERGLLDVPWTGTLVIQGFLFLAALLVGLPFAAAFPRYTGRSVRQVRRSVWKCSLTGAIAIFLVPMLAFIAMITVIGIPLGMVLMCGYAILLYLSKIIVGLAVGGLILGRRGPQPFSAVCIAMAVGLLLLYIAASLPMVGHAVMIAICFMGVGGLILGLTASAPEPPPSETEQSRMTRTRDSLSP